MALGEHRGHCLSKSRRWSTRFKDLRSTRQRHVHEQLLANSADAAQRELAALAPNRRLATFAFAGIGHLTTADAYLAAQAAARAREERELARDALMTTLNRRPAHRRDLPPAPLTACTA